MSLPRYDWQVIVRDPDLAFVGRAPVERLELRPIHLGVGEWVIDVPFDGDLTGPAGQLLTPRAGVVFVVNNTIVMSGPVTRPVRIRAEDGTHTLQVAGSDDLWHLATRHARQSPDEAAPTLGLYSDARDIVTGVAETVIKHYVDVNAGPGAVVARRIAGLQLAPDLARGATVTGSARLPDPLVEFIAGLAAVGGLGFRAVQTAPGEITFDVFVPADKTASVKFSTSLRNLRSYEYETEAPTATHVTVGGGGEDAARYYHEAAVTSDWGRIETFVDQRHTTDPTELAQAADEALAEGAERFSIRAELQPTPAHQWAPVATDPAAATYDLGDRVSVIIDGVEITETIRELRIVHEAGKGTQMVPIVGTRNQGDPQDRNLELLIRSLRALARRVDVLEQR